MLDAKVTDSRSNTQLTITTDRIQRFSDLPTVAPHGYVMEITGDHYPPYTKGEGG